MILRISLVVSILLTLATTAWALYEKHESEEFMLRMLYLDSTTRIKNNLYVLSNLRDGRNDVAIQHLERILGTDIAILEGCAIDLCKEATPPEIIEALETVSEYKNGH